MIDVRRLETSKEPPKINHISSNAAVHDLRPLSLTHYYTGKKKIGTLNPFVCVCVFIPPSATQKASQRSIPKFQRLHSFCARVFQGARKGVYQASVTPSSSFCCHCSCLRRPAAVYRIHSVVSSSFASYGMFDRNGRTLVVVVSLVLIALSAQISYSWPLCVALISVCCFPVHSMYGFRTPPTIPIPSARKPAGSFALITLTGGSRGLSALTCAASLAACSMASISSLQAAWSKGHTTIGCLSRMSRADDSLACTVC